MAKKVKHNLGAVHTSIYQQERQIGREGAAMATRFVRSKIKESSLMLRGIGSPNKKGKKNINERKPLLEATYIRPIMGDYRLLGMQFYSNRVGFVHHFGVTRDNTRFIQTHPKTGTVFKKRKGALDSQAFFNDIYEKSGALQHVLNGFAKTRTRFITQMLQNQLIFIAE